MIATVTLYLNYQKLQAQEASRLQKHRSTPKLSNYYAIKPYNLNQHTEKLCLLVTTLLDWKLDLGEEKEEAKRHWKCDRF